MHKLAADGVTVTSPRAIEYGLCVNEADRDLTYLIVKKSTLIQVTCCCTIHSLKIKRKKRRKKEELRRKASRQTKIRKNDFTYISYFSAIKIIVDQCLIMDSWSSR